MKVFGLDVKGGEISQGFFDLFTYATGVCERIPVVILGGAKEGKTISVGANMHGDEQIGSLVILDLIKEARTTDFLQHLEGTVILFPSLNPLGALRAKRTFSIFDYDINGFFPEGKEHEKKKEIEQITENFVSELSRHTSFHIDLHCSKICSDSFIYVRKAHREEDRDVCRESFHHANTFGFPVLYNEQTPGKKMRYASTLVGSLVYFKKIPSFTVELGSRLVVDNRKVASGLSGVKNVIASLGLIRRNVALPSRKNFIGSAVLKPLMPKSGVVKFLVTVGEEIEVGTPVAELRNIFGEEICGGKILSTVKGKVLYLYEGAFFNQGQPLLRVAVREETLPLEI